MKEYSFEDVRECNYAYIHCVKDGKAFSVKANKKRLTEILQKATEEEQFFDKMIKELNKEYQKKTDEVNALKYYSFEEVEEARDWRKYGLDKRYEMQRQNDEVKERRHMVYGFYEAVRYSYERWQKYHKLAAQARGGLNHA